MLRVLAMTVILVVSGGLQSGARSMFYDPGNGQAGSVETGPAPTGGLRPIAVLDRFPSFGYVGIHYWFETADRTPLTEQQAAAFAGAVSLHVRANVAGSFSVWSIERDSDPGVELTPADYRLAAGQEYVVPGSFEFRSEKPGRSVLVLSRAQQEQVKTAWGAVNKLAALSKRTSQNSGLQLVRETEGSIRGEVGTYVVNQDGGPVAAEILVVSRTR